MKKLKDILSEAYAWERKPGQALPTLAEVQAEYQRNKAAKPDFLDLDNDGDKEEPMKSAAHNMNEEDDETHSVSVAETGVEPYDAAYEDPKDAMIESFWKRVSGNLHGHEHILRESFRK